MSFHKKNIAVICFAMLLAAGTLFSGVNAAQAETVGIDGPFGDVPLGSVGVSAIKVNAPADSSRTLLSMAFTNDAAGQFSVNSTLPLSGLNLAPGTETVIEVSFEPTVAGSTSATLVITTLTTSGWTNVPGEIHLNLTGSGLAPEVDEAAATETAAVEDLLTFFDLSVANETLQGKGKGKSAHRRIVAVRDRIKSVEKSLERKKPRRARWQAYDALMKVRYNVNGSAKAELEKGLEKLSADLKSGKKRKHRSHKYNKSK